MKKDQIMSVLVFVGVLLGTIAFRLRLPGVTLVAEPTWTAFVGIPAAMACVLLLFPMLGWVSRKRYSIASFAQTYYFVMLVTLILLAYFQILVLRALISPLSNMAAWVMGGIFIALGLIGNVMGKTRRNLALGLRVPWALANERTWVVGSRRAGQVMVGVALAGLLLTILGANKWVLLSLLAATVIVLNVCSLVAYRRFRHEHEPGQQLH